MNDKNDKAEPVTEAEGVTLLPCPFCGSDAKFTGRSNGKCGQVTCTSDECFGPMTTAMYKADSVEQWNRRAQPPQPTGDVGELVPIGINLVAVAHKERKNGNAELAAIIERAAAVIDQLRRANSRTNELTKERDEWRQCAGVEAGLRREFLARAEKAEHLAEQRKGKKETIATARNRALNGLEHFKARVAELEKERDARPTWGQIDYLLDHSEPEFIGKLTSERETWIADNMRYELRQHVSRHRAALSPTEPAGRSE